MSKIEIKLPVQLENLPEEIRSLKNQIQELKENLQPKEPTVYLTRSEVAELFKVDLSTIHNWSRKKILTPLQIGGRVYFRVKDIEKQIIELKK